MAQFRINYSKVISQANDVYTLSSELSSEIVKLEELLILIKSEWHGPASVVFQGQLVMLIADLRKTMNSLSSVSSTIKSVANRIKQEDERLAASLVNH